MVYWTDMPSNARHSASCCDFILTAMEGLAALETHGEEKGEEDW
jgi:hypothetical protein